MMNQVLLPLAAFFLLIVHIAPAQINNVRVDSNAHNQSETAIVISPLNSDIMLATWNDFRPTQPGGANPKPGFAFSTDGGHTWLGDIISSTGGYPNGFDPSAAFDRYGRAFYCYGATNTSQGDPPRIYISRTSTFSPPDWDPHEVHPIPQQHVRQDKPFMAIDNTEGQYDGHIYVSWTQFGDPNYPNFEDYVGIRFAYSTNGGETFTGHRTLDEVNGPVEFSSFELDGTYGLKSWEGLVHWSMPAVGPNGEVYVCWFYYPGDGFNQSRCRIAKSTNGGEDFGGWVDIASLTWTGDDFSSS